ncbi:putative reverse transcriptase domain-containing protein [Tanacetum coccineum]|uniref:Reverse transcriptase domain-containing protein n=1 Tax=Tanacetum coccineum TaxID=301880 RepID=A0ABQ5AH85_9ASTR
MNEEEEEEEDPEMEEEMEEENDDDDDAEIINHYEEADPLNLPLPDSDTESEDMAVAHTPDDHEQESKADTVGTITRDGMSHSTSPEFDTDVRSEIKGQHALRRNVYTGPLRFSGTYTRSDIIVKDICGTTAQWLLVDNVAARKEGDDTATTSDPQPSQPPGSPHYHMYFLHDMKEIRPPRAMTQAAIEKLVSDRVAATLALRFIASRRNTNGSGRTRRFHGNESAVELCRWFEKTKSVFSISECAERNKVKFVAATLQSRALTWWNSQVATLGLEVVNAKSWNDMKIMMREDFCPSGKIQKNGRWQQQQRHGNARALTTTQNAGANQTGVAPKCNRCGICHFDQCPPKCNNCGKMGHKEKDCRSRNVASGTNARSAIVCYECGERGHKSNACPKRADQQGGNVRGQAYVVRDAEHNQGPNVVTGTFLLNNRYVTILFDSGADKSFVDVRLSHLLDIKPAKLNTSYEVELADGKVVCTNTVLKGCTLNLLDHLFDIDLMPIELGTFDVIIGMDWLVERDAVIVCGKKEVHVPYKNKTLVVKGDSGAPIKAQVTEKEPSKKQLQDVPVIRNFPEVFPDDLPGLPPPRQVEFRIELCPEAAPVQRVHIPF